MGANKLNELRVENGGSLPSLTSLGAYPIVYLTGDGMVICAGCANEPDTSDPVVDGDVNWEGPTMACDDCGKALESAYGDPDHTCNDVNPTTTGDCAVCAIEATLQPA